MQRLLVSKRTRFSNWEMVLRVSPMVYPSFQVHSIISSGTDVHVAAPGDDTNSIRQMFLNRVARAHTDVSQAVSN